MRSYEKCSAANSNFIRMVHGGLEIVVTENNCLIFVPQSVTEILKTILLALVKLQTYSTKTEMSIQQSQKKWKVSIKKYSFNLTSLLLGMDGFYLKLTRDYLSNRKQRAKRKGRSSWGGSRANLNTAELSRRIKTNKLKKALTG